MQVAVELAPRDAEHVRGAHDVAADDLERLDHRLMRGGVVELAEKCPSVGHHQ